MPIEYLSDAMKRIVGPQEDHEELGSGFGGTNGPTEGPVWWREGGYLLFSDIHGSRRMKWEPGKGISVDMEGTANANGMTRDRQGRLIVCHHFSRCVDRVEADGSISEPLSRVGLLAILDAKPRRRRGSSDERRPRFLVRRKTGWDRGAGRIDGDELIARD